MEKAILPLDEYLKSFDPFLDILKMNPDEMVRAIEMEENPREIDSIKEEIANVYRKIENLKL
jgi:hypothetical protein